jgi:hypothetical protein
MASLPRIGASQGGIITTSSATNEKRVSESFVRKA